MAKLIKALLGFVVLFFVIQGGIYYLKKSQYTVNYDDLQDRKGIAYLPNKSDPFSGIAEKRNDKNVLIKSIIIVNGKPTRKDDYYDDGKKKETLIVNGSENLANSLFDNSPNFEIKAWHPNGRLKSIGSLQDGIMKESHYFDNGQKSSEVEFDRNGKIVGEWLSFDRDGNQIRYKN